MKVDAQLTEEDLVDLIVLAGVNEFRKEQRTPTESKTIWTKVAFSIIEELKLPVTHYWYRYGGWIETGRLEAQRILQVYGAVETDKYPDPKKIFSLSQANRELFERISAAVKERHDMFSADTTDLRRSLYIEDAPERMRDAYLPNLDLMEICRSTVNNVDNEILPIRAAEAASSKITDLHLAIARLGYPWEQMQQVIEFTDLIEKTLISLKSWPLNGGRREAWVRHFGELIKSYDSTGWVILASHFAAESVKGPRKDAVVQSMKRKGEESTRDSQKALRALTASLASDGFLPSAMELDAAIKVRRSGKHEKELALITDHFVEFTKGE
ncbi:MAG: hypothetical protein NT137_01340 [Methanomassiliicoccales archaeon]|nr:hypothetical protein [Methanomassiliicoccales archaeon]